MNLSVRVLRRKFTNAFSLLHYSMCCPLLVDYFSPSISGSPSSTFACFVIHYVKPVPLEHTSRSHSQFGLSRIDGLKTPNPRGATGQQPILQMHAQAQNYVDIRLVSVCPKVSTNKAQSVNALVASPSRVTDG